MSCLQAERCSLFLVDKKSKELVAKVFDGNTLADGSTEVGSDYQIILCRIIMFCFQQTEVRLPLDTGIVGHVVKTGQLINVHNVYKMIIDGFSHMGNTVFYMIAITILCSHLSHGFASVFQTLGLRSRKSELLIARAGWAYALLIWVGFLSIPVAILFFGYGRT